MKTKIISAFPGVGKSYCFEHNTNMADSDSSEFSWESKGVRHPDFPNNYIKHIKSLMGEKQIIFVSSHKVVRDALVSSHLYFTLVFPERNLKDEYIQRFKNRGNDPGFIKMLDNKWDEFMDDMETQANCDIVRIKTNEYLSDCISKDQS